MENWYLPESISAESLTALLGKKFVIREKTSSTSQVVYWDSFDWRLYNAGYILSSAGQSWSLITINSGETVARQGGPKGKKSLFTGEFPPGAVQKKIQPLLDIRAILPLLGVSTETTPLEVMNKDVKITARVFLKNHEVENGDTVKEYCEVSLQGIRGYANTVDAIVKVLLNKGITEKSAPHLALTEGLKCCGRKPLDYSSKFRVQLDPDLTASGAVVRIYSRLLETMHRNVNGVVNDLDSEFLHDLRVAIRRTRSGLSLIKNVLPPEEVAYFKQEFAHLGSITGPTRDLDVYLLYKEDYSSRLPASLLEGLEVFFEDLTARRVQEQKKLARQIKAQRFKTILSSWEAFLGSKDIASAPLAEVPVIDIAKKIIFRRYKRVMKDGLAIDNSSPDQDLHRLRIQGKKLRYSIEFFSTLFPEDDISRVLKHLKQLQNNLGDFNDLSVQQDMLQVYLASIRPGSRKNLDLGSALGGLMSNLHQEQQQVRKAFKSTFSSFNDLANQKLFNQLFNEKNGVV